MCEKQKLKVEFLRRFKQNIRIVHENFAFIKFEFAWGFNNVFRKCIKLFKCYWNELVYPCIKWNF